MASFDEVLANKAISEFLEEMAFDVSVPHWPAYPDGTACLVSLSLAKCVLYEPPQDALKVVLDFLVTDDGQAVKKPKRGWRLSDEECDEIQDEVLDHLKANGLEKKLKAAGMDERVVDDINWVHVSVNGEFLFD